MLVAVGRGPVVEDLGLAEIGVEYDPRKGIAADEHRRTTVDHIYAVGDCAGYWQLAHTAFREGEVAAENACGHEAIVDNRAVPRPIYTDPEVASVGLTEAEAREQYGDDVAVGQFPWVANARAVMQNETIGWVKSIHETRYGELLGVVMVGPHVTDLIEAGVVAIDAEATVETVADGMAAHPTLSEADQGGRSRGARARDPRPEPQAHAQQRPKRGQTQQYPHGQLRRCACCPHSMTPLFAQRTPGSSQRFRAALPAHVQDVYRYALLVLRNRADAEDVAQTTFMNAYRAIQRGDRPRHPRNWLIKIAHNTCRTRMRDAKRRPKEVSLEPQIADTAAIRTNEDVDVRELVHALGALSFNQRSALVMRELEGRSYAEIADALGPLELRGRDAALPRPPRHPRAARRPAHLRRGRARALAPARRTPSIRGAWTPSRTPARVRRVRDARATRARTSRRAPEPRPAAAARLAHVVGGGGGAAVGTGIAAKAAAVVAAGAVAAGAGHEVADAVDRPAAAPRTELVAPQKTRARRAGRASVKRAKALRALQPTLVKGGKVGRPTTLEPIAAEAAATPATRPEPAGPAAAAPAT